MKKRIEKFEKENRKVEMFKGNECEMREIKEVTIKGEEERKKYRTFSPFGCGYTDNYDRVLATKRSVMKLFGENPERDIVFIEAH